MPLKPLLVLVLWAGSQWALALEPATTYPVDPKSGLIMAPGWQGVNQQCNACHSSQIVLQNRGNREFWRETLQWMIDTQGLWDLSDTWEPTLQYLSTYYGEEEIDMATFRRKPISRALMPPTREEVMRREGNK